MTLNELECVEREWVTAAEVASIIGADPNWIRLQARQDASRLGFPVIVYRSRVKIPKMPFINFMRGCVDEKTMP